MIGQGRHSYIAHIPSVLIGRFAARHNSDYRFATARDTWQGWRIWETIIISGDADPQSVRFREDAFLQLYLTAHIICDGEVVDAREKIRDLGGVCGCNAIAVPQVGVGGNGLPSHSQ